MRYKIDKKNKVKEMNEINPSWNGRKLVRSLFVIKDIKKGEKFTEDNIKSIRPGYGIAPKYEKAILGKEVIRDIKRGEPILWEMLRGKVKLTKAIPTDYKIVHSIRYSEDVMKNSLSKNKVSLEEFKKWFSKEYKKYKMINKNQGFIKNDNGFIGIALKKEYRGKGLAHEVLLNTDGKAVILTGNEASLCCFIKSGFVIKGHYLEKDFTYK